MTTSQQKCLIQKYKFLFIKNFYTKLTSHIICNLTHLQDKNTKIKFMLRISEKNHVGFETGSESGYGSETNCKIGSVCGSKKIIPDYNIDTDQWK